MAVALVGGAAIGALFGVLYDVVKESMGRTVMQYKPLLEDLKFTLDCLRPRIIQEIGDHNVALGLPNDDIERLQQQMEEGIKLVGRLSKLSMWNCYVLCSCCKCSKPSYTDRLIQLDRSLRALLEGLRLQEARDIKENLLLNRKIYEKQDELATRQSEILKIAGEILRAQQEDKGVQELSGSSAQTVVQEQIGGSGVQQAASINRGGAALGAVFEVLFSAVLQTKEKKRMFKRILGHLESTLDSIKPLIEEIAEYNKVLHLTEEELESFRVEMEKGVELVRKSSKVSLWASNKKNEYTKKLLGLDESLQRLINKLRVQLARDARESLVSVTNIETVTMKIEESGIIQHDQTESRRPLVELPSGDRGESSGSGAETTPHEQNGENGGQQMAPSGGGVGAAALGAALARDARESLVSVSNIEAVINQIEGSGVVKLQNEQNEAKGSCEVPAAMAKSAVGLNALSVEGTRDVTETLDPEANIKVGWQKDESWVAQSKTEHPSRTVGLDAMNIQVGARSMEETSVSDVEPGLKRIEGKEVSELDAPFRELKEDVLKDEEDEELAEQVEDHHDRKKKGAESVTGASGDGMAICKADGCAVDLSDAKAYNRRHRVCELHSKAPLVIVSGLKRRFCHKCSRFHDLSEFDDTKQSCRRHLPYIERDGTGTQLKDVSGDIDTVISRIEWSGVVQSQNDQSEIKDSYAVVEATAPAVGLNVPSVKGTRDAKETLQTTASNTEAGLEQIQGKDVLDFEPLYAVYKETEYIHSSVTVGLNVLLRGLKRFLLNDELSAVVLTGPQGSGKTTLAKYFCEDEEVKNIFKNNIFFVLVSKNPSLSLMVQTLYQQIEPKGFQIPALQDESIALHWLHQFFMKTALHPSVLVLDDVWPGSESILDKFDEFKTPNYKIMVTSRSEFPAFGCPYYLKSLSAEGEMTLSHQSHTHIESLDDEDLTSVSLPPSVTFDDKSLIDHFPDSSVSDLGDRSSHVSTAMAKSVSHQREIERRAKREQLEDRLQRAKRQRAGYLRQRGKLQISFQVSWNRRMHEEADLLSRKLARCWRRFLTLRRTTLALAKDYDALKINEKTVKLMPFEQLAILMESTNTLQTLKALLDRLEIRLKVSRTVASINYPSSFDNIDHLLKRVASPRKRTTPRTSLRSRDAKKESSIRDTARNSVKLSRYPMRVVLCAYMILGHPDAVFSGSGEPEISLAKSAEEFVRQFELLLKVILDDPVQSSDEESDSSLPKHLTFRSQLGAFDKAWCSYLNCFVCWKVKDARLLVEDLVRAACHLELSMIQTCQMTPQGDSGDLTHDIKAKAIQKQVTEDQKLLREKVQHLGGDAGIERMKSAISETRLKYFQAKENGSPSGLQVTRITSPSPPSSPLSPSASADKTSNSGRVQWRNQDFSGEGANLKECKVDKDHFGDSVYELLHDN